MQELTSVATHREHEKSTGEQDADWPDPGTEGTRTVVFDLECRLLGPLELERRPLCPKKLSFSAFARLD